MKLPCLYFYFFSIIFKVEKGNKNMGIKKIIKETIKDYKEKNQKKRELDNIKQEAYFEEMKIQSKKMGIKQAQIEVDMREKVFRAKLKAKNKKRELQHVGVNKPVEKIDVFGLNQRPIPQEVKII